MAENIEQPDLSDIPPDQIAMFVPSSVSIGAVLQNAAGQTITGDNMFTMQEFEPALREVNRQLEELRATNAQQAEEIARLGAAVRSLPCPDGHPDHYVKEEDAICTVADCIRQGHCNCDTGFILAEVPPAAQPWPEDATVPTPDHPAEAA